MGALLYGDRRHRIDIDDRTLAHLQVIVGSKLRRREPFFFTFDGRGGTRSSVWISTSVPLHFTYLGARPPALNRRWLDALMASANSAHGLVLIAEPPDEP